MESDNSHEHIRKRIVAAEQCAERNDFAGAESRYLEMIKLWPNLSVLHNNLGVIYENMDNWQAAVKCYETATSLSHHPVNVYEENLINGYLHIGRYEDAAQAAIKAFADGCDSPLLHSLTSVSFLETRRFSEATPHLEHLVEENTKMPATTRFDYNLSLLECYVVCGTHGQGVRKTAERLLEFGHPSEQRMYKSAVLLAQAGLIRYASEMLQKTVLLSAASLELKMSLGEQWLRVLQLIKTINDTDEERRLRTVNILINFYDPEIVGALLPLVKDASPMIREAVVEFFSRWDIPRLNPDHNLLFDEVDYVRKKYVEYLRIAEPAKIRTKLKKAMECEEKPEIRAEIEALWIKNNEKLNAEEKLSSFVDSMKHVEGYRLKLSEKLSKTLGIDLPKNQSEKKQPPQKKHTPVEEVKYTWFLVSVLLISAIILLTLKLTGRLDGRWLVAGLATLAVASYVPWHRLFGKKTGKQTKTTEPR